MEKYKDLTPQENTRTLTDKCARSRNKLEVQKHRDNLNNAKLLKTSYIHQYD